MAAVTKLSKNTQMFILVASAFLVLHLYNMFLYQPIRKQTRFLSQEKVRITNELGTINADKDELAKAETIYQDKFEEFSRFEAEVTDLEQKLPSRKNMAELLKQLTSALSALEADFVAIEPTTKRAGEGEVFDSIEIKMKFYADYPVVVSYLKMLENQPIIFLPKRVEMKLDEEVNKPFVTIFFSTYISDRTVESNEQIIQTNIDEPAKNPFKSASKPYDNRLPGDHKLSMVIWKGPKKMALIDGKLMSAGSLIDNKTLESIESDGVWFVENGIKYYLKLEKNNA